MGNEDRLGGDRADGPRAEPPVREWELQLACAQAQRISSALLAAALRGASATEAVASIASLVDRLTVAQRAAIAAALADRLGERTATTPPSSRASRGR